MRTSPLWKTVLVALTLTAASALAQTPTPVKPMAPLAERLAQDRVHPLNSMTPCWREQHELAGGDDRSRSRFGPVAGCAVASLVARCAVSVRDRHLWTENSSRAAQRRLDWGSSVLLDRNTFVW
jgi:hypothetical protein